MTPAVEFVPLMETASGLAFEVKIKGDNTEKVMTSGRARLESYVNGPLPSLLRHRSLGSENTVQQDGRVDKARKHNELQKLRTERQLAENDKLAHKKKAALEQRMGKAVEKREDALASRKTRAGQHFESVRAKGETSQQQHSEVVTSLAQRLHRAMNQKSALRDANVAQRSSRAAQHNEAVQEKSQLQMEAKERQTEESRSKGAADRLAHLTMRAIESNYLPQPVS